MSEDQKTIIDFWSNIPRETTPEQDLEMARLAPDEFKPYFMARAALSPEERTTDLQIKTLETHITSVIKASELAVNMTNQYKAEEKSIDKQIALEDKRIQHTEIKNGQGASRTRAPQLANPNHVIMELAVDKNAIPLKLDFGIEPYLPRKSVVGFYGRGEGGKSSLLATFASDISSWGSTLWISSEEDLDHIKYRHLCGIPAGDGSFTSVGRAATLDVYKTIRIPKADGTTFTTDFNVYEHLESAIIMSRCNLQNAHQAAPLFLVVLDTVVTLTTFEKQAGPNSDEGVKRLFSFLRGIAEKYDVCIAVVGHCNKGNQEHFADSVMGSSAWINSPRLSFMVAKDRTIEGRTIIRVAKANLIPAMAQLFDVNFVYELHQFKDGPKAALVKFSPGQKVWGSSEAEALWKEVTTLPEEAITSKRPSLVKETISKIKEMVHSDGVEFVTREQVEQEIGRQIFRPEWTKIDNALRASLFLNKVTVDKGDKNKSIYRKYE